MSHEDEAIYEIFYTDPIKCCQVIVEVGVEDSVKYGVKYSFSKFYKDALNLRSLVIEADPVIYQQLQVNRPDSVSYTHLTLPTIYSV